MCYSLGVGRLRYAARCLLLLSIAAGSFPRAVSAQADPLFDVLGRVNALRRQGGLAPLELNDQLTAPAQRHSQDMANTGSVSHTGSDGSTPDQRIIAAGYGPAPSAWGENIYGGGIATVDDAWRFWTTSPIHRNNLLKERYREIGIGVATSVNGGTYYTLNFGARPGVLPFFVDQGGLLSDPLVTLTLSNEDAESGGAMGHAVEVRVGEGEDLSAVAWQPWQRSIPFTLSNVAGQHRITVEYRDAGNTLVSYFRIVSLASAQLPVTPSPSATLKTESSATAPPPSATPGATLSPTDTPTSTPTGAPSPSTTPTSVGPPRITPAPSATLRTDPSATLAVASQVTATGVPVILAATAPGSTPLPTGGMPLPPASLDETPIDAMIARGWSDAPADLLGLIVGLQIAALVIAVAILVRRSMKS